MKRRTQASLQYFKALRQRSQNHIQRPWMRSSSVKSYNIHSELTNTYLANALNQYSSLQPKDLQPINLSFDLNGQQKSAKGKAPQQPDRDFEACARLNERKSEERNPRHSGNCYMVTNGVWSYIWDAENRLTAIYSNDTLLVSNIYDHKSRRIAKIISSSGAEAQRRDFIYDNWNLIQEAIHDSQLTITNSYTWGLDLSGKPQGVGGVGGLLALSRDGTAYFPCFDANGNVTEYIDASSSIRAHYTFDAFGNTISQSEDLASTFSHRFSTKYVDDETGLYYYGYRYYAPEIGRWVNRDQIEEGGGVNLYGFLRNNSINSLDILGNNIAAVEESECPGYLVKFMEHLGRMEHILPALLAKCNDSKCVCDSKAKKQCESEAKKIAARIRSVFVNNYDTALDDPITYPDPSDLVGTFFCWDWSRNFYSELMALKPMQFTFFHARNKGPVNHNGVGPIHYFVHIYIGKKDPTCALTLDDDWQGKNGFIHEGLIPPTSSGEGWGPYEIVGFHEGSVVMKNL